MGRKGRSSSSKDKASSRKKEKESKGSEQRIIISASDIEKYAYCPLSWWLKQKKAVEDRTDLDRGTETHENVGRDMAAIIEGEQKTESDLLAWAILVGVAVLLGLNGMMVLFAIVIGEHTTLISTFMIVLALLWSGAGVFFFINLVIRQRKRAKELEKASAFRKKKKLKATQALASSTRTTLKKSAWVILAAAAFLIANAAVLWLPMEDEVLRPVLITMAIVWIIGSWIAIGASFFKKDSMFADKRLLIICTVVASILAFNALSVTVLKGWVHSGALTQSIVILGGIWIVMSMFLIYLSLTGGLRAMQLLNTLRRKGKRRRKKQLLMETSLDAAMRQESRSVLLFAGVSVVMAFNSVVIWYNPSDDLAIFFEVVALLWLAGASAMLFFYLLSRRTVAKLKTVHGVAPDDRVSYTDNVPTGSNLLFYDELGIDGRPDYILEKDGKQIPVEVKTGRIPQGPYFSHILQITAYCMMVEDVYGKKPPHGVIRYLDGETEKEYEVEFDQKTKDLVTEKVLEMRKHLIFENVHRNHNRPGKCRTCSRRKECPEKIDA